MSLVDSGNVGSIESDTKNNEQDENLYKVTSDEVLEQIEKADENTTIVVDFDETLWLRNSTELFLSSIRPGFLVSLLLQLIGFIKPWKLFHRSQASAYRDLYRVKCILFFIPSALKQWAKVAELKGPELLNKPLYDKLVEHGLDKVHIASYGYDFIITPLVNAIDPSLKLTVCSTLNNAGELRIGGKASAIGSVIGFDALANSIVITDSLLDKDLLQSCRTGALVVWPDAEYAQAGMSPMLPFVYLKKIKRPTESYFVRAILGHDYFTLLLAFALFHDQPVICAIGLFFFLLSYFSAYEIGYYENDSFGLKYEKSPKVSQSFLKYGDGFDPKVAWICSMLLAFIGSLIVADSVSSIPVYLSITGVPAVFTVFASFMLFLVMVRLVFAWFNRIDVKGRIIPMLFLQLARTSGYVFFFSTSISGELLCVSLAFSKWVPYLVYRFGGDRKGFPSHLTSFILFTTFILVFAYGGSIDFATLFDTQAIVILAYLLLRSIKDIWSFRAHMKFVY